MAKKKPSIPTAKSLLSLVILLLMGIITWWLYNRNLPHFIRYPEFGIELPTHFSIHGIDVSKYQNNINWTAVKEMEVDDVQIGFSFIKATEGLGNVDYNFKRNWNNTKEAGMPRGAYHFFLATKSGKLQAENFISRVQLEKGDLPPVLDVEQAFGVKADKLRERVKEFLDVVEAYYNVTPIIYTNVDFYNQYLKGDFDGYPLWVAHYLQKDRPRITRDWTFWQHSENGLVNGISSKVDFNVFKGDSSDFQKLLIQ